ncbi:hypothetical protein LEMLEM_LOCUS20284 [Lemmus lemmus]
MALLVSFPGKNQAMAWILFQQHGYNMVNVGTLLRRQDVTLTPSLLIQRGSAHSSSLTSSQHHHAESLHCNLWSHHNWTGEHRGLDESFTCEPESHSGHSCGHNTSLCVDNLPLVETKVQDSLKVQCNPTQIPNAFL